MPNDISPRQAALEKIWNSKGHRDVWILMANDAAARAADIGPELFREAEVCRQFNANLADRLEKMGKEVHRIHACVDQFAAAKDMADLVEVYRACDYAYFDKFHQILGGFLTDARTSGDLQRIDDLRRGMRMLRDINVAVDVVTNAKDVEAELWSERVKTNPLACDKHFHEFLDGRAHFAAKQHHPSAEAFAVLATQLRYFCRAAQAMARAKEDPADSEGFKEVALPSTPEQADLWFMFSRNFSEQSLVLAEKINEKRLSIEDAIATIIQFKLPEGQHFVRPEKENEETTRTYFTSAFLEHLLLAGNAESRASALDHYCDLLKTGHWSRKEAKDSQDRTEVTYGFVPRADSVLFVLDATAPVTQSEMDFLTTAILKERVESLVFASNFSDLLADDARPGAEIRTRNRLSVAVDMPDPKVCLVSAKRGLDPLSFSESGLDKLTEHLRAVTSEGPRRIEKAVRMRDRLLLILASARGDLEKKKQASQLSAEDLKRQTQALEEQWRRRENQVVQMRQWVQERETEVLAMTEKSLETFFRNLYEDTSDLVQAYSGPDFKSMIESQLPIQVKKRCKAWVDSHSDTLRAVVMRLSSELTEALCREFKTTMPLLEPHFVSAAIGPETFQAASPEKSHRRLYAGLIAGGAGALLAVVGLPILAPLIGLAAFPYFGKPSREIGT